MARQLAPLVVLAGKRRALRAGSFQIEIAFAIHLEREILLYT